MSFYLTKCGNLLWLLIERRKPMPLVRMIHNGENFPEADRLEKVREDIKVVVAGALSCGDPGGTLLPGHIEVEVNVTKPGDSLHKDFDVMFFIDANYFPSRNKDLQRRNNMITDHIRCIPEFTSLHCFVWTRLFFAAFTEF